MDHQTRNPTVPSEPSTEFMPTWTWEELERALIGFAASEMQVDMVGPLVSATRKQAPFYSKDLLLKEILAITYVIGDEGFSGECGEGPDMT